MSSCSKKRNTMVIEKIDLSDEIVKIASRKQYVPKHCLEVVATGYRPLLWNVNKIYADDVLVGTLIVSRTKGNNENKINEDLALAGGAEIFTGVTGDTSKFVHIRNSNRMGLFLLEGSTMTESQAIELCVPLHGDLDANTSDPTNPVIYSEGNIKPVASLKDLVSFHVRTSAVSIWQKIEAFTAKRNLPGTLASRELLISNVVPSLRASCVNPIWQDLTWQFRMSEKSKEAFAEAMEFYDNRLNSNHGCVGLDEVKVANAHAADTAAGEAQNAAANAQAAADAATQRATEAQVSADAAQLSANQYAEAQTAADLAATEAAAALTDAQEAATAAANAAADAQTAVSEAADHDRAGAESALVAAETDAATAQAELVQAETNATDAANAAAQAAADAAAAQAEAEAQAAAALAAQQLADGTVDAYNVFAGFTGTYYLPSTSANIWVGNVTGFNSGFITSVEAYNNDPSDANRESVVSTYLAIINEHITKLITVRGDLDVTIANGTEDRQADNITATEEGRSLTADATTAWLTTGINDQSVLDALVSRNGILTVIFAMQSEIQAQYGSQFELDGHLLGTLNAANGALADIADAANVQAQANFDNGLDYVETADGFFDGVYVGDAAADLALAAEEQLANTDPASQRSDGMFNDIYVGPRTADILGTAQGIQDALRARTEQRAQDAADAAAADDANAVPFRFYTDGELVTSWLEATQQAVVNVETAINAENDAAVFLALNAAEEAYATILLQAGLDMNDEVGSGVAALRDELVVEDIQAGLTARAELVTAATPITLDADNVNSALVVDRITLIRQLQASFEAANGDGSQPELLPLEDGSNGDDPADV